MLGINYVNSQPCVLKETTATGKAHNQYWREVQRHLQSIFMKFWGNSLEVSFIKHTLSTCFLKGVWGVLDGFRGMLCPPGVVKLWGLEGRFRAIVMNIHMACVWLVSGTEERYSCEPKSYNRTMKGLNITTRSETDKSNMPWAWINLEDRDDVWTCLTHSLAATLTFLLLPPAYQICAPGPFHLWFTLLGVLSPRYQQAPSLTSISLYCSVIFAGRLL